MISLRRCGLVAAMLLLVALQPASLHAQRCQGGSCQGGSCPAPWTRTQPFGLGQAGSLISQPPARPALDPQGQPYGNRPPSDPQPGEPWFAAVCRVTGSEGRGVNSVGSGVLVNWYGRRLVLTAHHVLKGTTGRIARFSTGASARLVGARGDVTWDYAVADLEGEVGTLPGAVELDDGDRPLPAGESLVSCGLGGDGRLAINRGQFMRYAPASRQTEGNWLVMSGQASGGDSGGPIFRRGKVAGVLWGSARGEVVGTQVGLIHWTLGSLYPAPIPKAGRPGLEVQAGPAVATQATPPSSPSAVHETCFKKPLFRKSEPDVKVVVSPTVCPPTPAPKAESPRPPAIAPKEPEPAGPNPLIIAVVIAAGGLGAAIVYYLTQKHST